MMNPIRKEALDSLYHGINRDGIEIGNDFGQLIVDEYLMEIIVNLRLLAEPLYITASELAEVIDEAMGEYGACEPIETEGHDNAQNH